MNQRNKVVSWFLFLSLILSCYSQLSLAEAVYTEGDYEYIIVNNQVTITKYVGAGGNVSIPSSLGNLPVTIIGDSAFILCKTVTDIVISDTITSIQPYAFSCCENLAKIKFPDSVISIGEAAFSDCTSLTDIALPDGISSVEGWLFAGCTNLRTIKIPDSVISIGDYAFARCNNLARDIIPDSVTTLGSCIFNRCEGLDVYVPTTVTNIADNAFCNQFMTANIINGVPVIGGTETFAPNQNLTLWVYVDSEAYRQAIELGIPTVTITEYTTETLGDINGDDSINAQDALLALQHSVRLIDLRGDSLSTADMNQDDSINAQDALQILQLSVGL